MVVICDLKLRLFPSIPLKWHNSAVAVALREALAALSGFSRVPCQQKLSIQRFLGCFPPVISAEVLHNLQFVQK